MLLINEEDIKKVFSMDAAIEAVKEAFIINTNKGVIAPLRIQIPNKKDNGTFLFMPAYVEEEEAAAIKIVNIFPNNINDNLPTAPAQVLFINGKTGIIESVINGTYLTKLRTGASSGLAFKLLAKKKCDIGTIIGTGSQAICQIEAMLCARNIRELRIFDIDIERSKKMKDDIINLPFLKDVDIVVSKTSSEAIENSDLIISVTSSTKPVFDANYVKNGATLSFIGSYQPTMQEMDPNLLLRASKVFFDSQEAVIEEAGDIIIPLEKGIISKDDLNGDIANVATNKVVGRENDEEIIIFKSVGVATQDLICAKKIYENALKNKIGLNWKE